MTENLAGRGEGLAGRLTESIWAISDGQHPDKDTLRNLIRNILAAAPAGTGRDVHWAIKAQCAHCVDGYPQRQAGDGYISNLGPVSDGEWFHHGMVHSSSGVVGCAAQYIHEALRRAALATPSPQAPAEQCQRCGQPDADGGGVFVDKEDALREEWLCGACVSKELRELRMAVATQKQPAGSAPHFIPLTPEQIKVNEEETISLASYHEIVGSPRKVGEDGAELLRQWQQREDDLRQALQFGHAGIVGMCRRELQLWLARPSSVPVGEQKQEEGV